MTRKLDRKPEGCKLLRVEVDIEGGIALSVRVRGDFFAHPEELFEEAEGALVGQTVAPTRAPLPSSATAPSPAQNGIREAALAAFSRPGLRLYGATAEAIADTIYLACGGDDAHSLS